MTVSMHKIQIEQALFEIRNAVVGRQRAIDRLVAGVVVGGPVALAGPPGVGKSHLVNVVARVFGLDVEQLGNSADQTAIEQHRMYVLDVDSMADSQGIVETLAETSGANLVLTTSATDLTGLSKSASDAVLSFVEIPYPTLDEEAVLALDSLRPTPADRILRSGDLFGLRAEACSLPVADPVVAYAVRLVQTSRAPSLHGLANLAPLVSAGASPRASIGLVRAARGLALIAGRSEVTHQDIYDAAYEVLIHRLQLSQHATQMGISSVDVVVELLSRVAA